MPVQDVLAFGESSVFLNSNVQCDTGGFVGNGVVVNNKSESEFILQIEKLKSDNSNKSQRIIDLEKHILTLEKQVNYLEKMALSNKN